MNTWEDALDRLDVSWCQGRGCVAGGPTEHHVGFRSYNPPTVHFTPEPDPEDRAALHGALALIGLVAAEQYFPSWEPPTQARAAFDFATDEMRHSKVSVPKALADRQPAGEAPPVKLFQADKASEREAPGMQEADTKEA